jgi:N-acetylglucosaminyldiphosphoundecaprenol N-acetyl-beta-D-mannosaminyltransferase
LKQKVVKTKEIELKRLKSKKMTVKMKDLVGQLTTYPCAGGLNQGVLMKIELLGIKIDNLGFSEAKMLIVDQIGKLGKFVVVTPNPEFLVEAQNHTKFREMLNQADLAIPDGQGLVLASKILGKQPRIKERVAGADLVEQLLIEAGQKGWKVGVVGARKGDKIEIEKEIEKLVEKYQIPNTKYQILASELTPDWNEQKFDLIFACQGMVEQEKWILENKDKINASVFMGIGGSLDFLSGFTKRAPLLIRSIGFEWLWRVLQKPSHIKRVWRATEVFLYLIIKEKLKKLT